MTQTKHRPKIARKAENDDVVVSSVPQEITDSVKSAYAALESAYEKSVLDQTYAKHNSDWSVLANQVVGREAIRR